MIFISYYLIQVLYIFGFTYYLQSELILNLSSLLPLTYFWINDHYYNEITIFNMFYWYVIFHYLSHTKFVIKYIHYIHHYISNIIIYRYIPDIFAYIINYCLKNMDLVNIYLNHIIKQILYLYQQCVLMVMDI